MTTPRRARGILLAATLLAFAIALSPLAVAHGFQESATPAPNSRFLEPPSEVVIRMTEPVEVPQTTVRVLDANGTDVTSGRVASPDGAAQSSVLVQPVALPGDGTYTVAWKALWVSDGHITEGSFAFVVGNATLPAASGDLSGSSAVLPGAAETAFRAMGFAGWIVAAGVLAYPRLVNEPAWRGHAGAEEAAARVRRRAASIGLAAGLLALVAAIGTLLDQASRAGYGLDVAALATQTSIGGVFAARAGLAALLVVATLVALRARRGHEAGAAIALAGLATLTLASHARAVQVRVPLATLPDFVHLVAAAGWVGTLVALLATLPIVLALTAPGERARIVGPLVARVSLVATVSVALLIATGTFAGIVHVGSVERLVSTLYGRVLLAKLALVAILLALGAVNRQVFTPAFRRARGALPEGRRGLDGFRGVVVTEVVLLAVVLAVTGALAGIAPQEHAVLAPTSKTFEAEGNEFQARLTLEPAVLGVNGVTMLLSDDDGAPLTDVVRLTLVLVHLDEDVPPAETVLEPAEAGGTFTGNVTFGLPGEWLVTAKVQRSTTYDDDADFFVTIPR